MKKFNGFSIPAIGLAILVGFITVAQAQTQSATNNAANRRAPKPQSRRAGFSLMPAGSGAGGPAFNIAPMGASGSLPVQGSGTLGRLTKWTALTSSNSVIGESSIFEDKFGHVGIGTDQPATKLTVAGTVRVNAADGQIGTLSIGGDGYSQPSGEAGIGVIGYGGNTTSNHGGTGLIGFGGNAGSGGGGTGVQATGGVNNGLTGVSGAGISAQGGPADGAGKTGGAGIVVSGGKGTNGAADGFAGYFGGTVEVSGNFSVTGGGTKNFKIDHPLDPENKYLYHAAIESSEVLNLYSGNVTTDESGEATVTLPDWFEAVNRDFRYQLTVVGTFAQAIVADEVKSHHFTIKTNAPNVKVSWQVTGIRSDAAMLKHPFKVEEEKPVRERGSYLTPEAYDQPEERGVNWARNPEMMLQLKQPRATAEQMLKSNKSVDR